MNAQMFDRFVILHSRFDGDGAPQVAELWRAGISPHRIRALFPLDLTAYFPKFREAFSDPETLTKLLAGNYATEKFERVLYPDEMLDVTEPFTYSMQSAALCDLARTCLPEEALTKLLANRRGTLRPAVTLEHQLKDAVGFLLDSFADTMTFCYNWQAYEQYLASYKPQFAISTKPDAHLAREATRIFAEMLLESLPVTGR